MVYKRIRGLPLLDVSIVTGAAFAGPMCVVAGLTDRLPRCHSDGRGSRGGQAVGSAGRIPIRPI